MENENQLYKHGTLSKMKEELRKHKENKCDCMVTQTRKLVCCYNWQIGLAKQIREVKNGRKRRNNI